MLQPDLGNQSKLELNDLKTSGNNNKMRKNESVPNLLGNGMKGMQSPMINS